MVTTPDSGYCARSPAFSETLEEHRLHFDGVALNRTLSDLVLPAGSGPREHAFRVLRLCKDAKRPCSRIGRSQIALCAKLPELARDVHSVEDLLYVALAFDRARPHSRLPPGCACLRSRRNRAMVLPPHRKPRSFGRTGTSLRRRRYQDAINGLSAPGRSLSRHSGYLEAHRFSDALSCSSVERRSREAL